MERLPLVDCTFTWRSHSTGRRTASENPSSLVGRNARDSHVHIRSIQRLARFSVKKGITGAGVDLTQYE